MPQKIGKHTVAFRGKIRYNDKIKKYVQIPVVPPSFCAKAKNPFFCGFRLALFHGVAKRNAGI